MYLVSGCRSQVTPFPAALEKVSLLSTFEEASSLLHAIFLASFTTLWGSMLIDL